MFLSNIFGPKLMEKKLCKKILYLQPQLTMTNFVNLPVHILEYTFSFLSGVQPACSVMNEANNIPELKKERKRNVLAKYKNVLKACKAGDEDATLFLLKETKVTKEKLDKLIPQAASQNMYRVCSFIAMSIKPNHRRVPLQIDDIAYHGYKHDRLIQLAINYATERTDWEYMLNPLVEHGDLARFIQYVKYCPREFNFDCLANAAGLSNNFAMIMFFKEMMLISENRRRIQVMNNQGLAFFEYEIEKFQELIETIEDPELAWKVINSFSNIEQIHTQLRKYY